MYLSSWYPRCPSNLIENGTARLPISETHTKNWFASEPERLRQFRDHGWKALGGENSDLPGSIFCDHFWPLILKKSENMVPTKRNPADLDSPCWILYIWIERPIRVDKKSISRQTRRVTTLSRAPLELNKNRPSRFGFASSNTLLSRS